MAAKGVEGSPNTDALKQVAYSPPPIRILKPLPGVPAGTVLHYSSARQCYVIWGPTRYEYRIDPFLVATDTEGWFEPTDC